VPVKKIIKIIKELNKTVKESYGGFRGSYLYGSQVKGTAHKDSDIDIVLLFDSELTHRQERDSAGIIGNIEYKYDVFIDYHPYTMQQLERNPFYYESVVEEGKYFDREAA
jgi:predicted nucleotidyltransferase